MLETRVIKQYIKFLKKLANTFLGLYMINVNSDWPINPAAKPTNKAASKLN